MLQIDLKSYLKEEPDLRNTYRFTALEPVIPGS